MNIEATHSESIKPIAQQIEEYFADAEIGSAKLLALGDLVANTSTLRRLREDRTDLITSLTKHPQEDLNYVRLPLESNLRIEEARLAIIEERIQQRKISLPGYASAFANIKRFQQEYSATEIKDRYEDLNDSVQHAKIATEVDNITFYYFRRIYDNLAAKVANRS